MIFYRVLKINFLLMVKTKTSPEGSYLKLNYLNGIRIFLFLIRFFYVACAYDFLLTFAQ